MPDVVFAILGALVRCNGWASVAMIVEVSGYSRQTFEAARPGLMRRSWTGRSGGELYITERGKLALAIETGRRTKRRGQRTRYSLKEFQRAA